VGVAEKNVVARKHLYCGSTSFAAFDSASAEAISPKSLWAWAR
jgi:hypothetical protein